MSASRRLGPGWIVAGLVVALTVAAVFGLDLRVEALGSPEAAGRALQRLWSLAQGFTRPDLSADALSRCAQLAVETLAVAAIGTGLGAAGGLVLGMLGSTSVMASSPAKPSPAARVVVGVARSLMDVLRAIPDFAWALVLLVPLGPGPVTGALAIAVTVTGVLGRTYGQLVDAVPHAQVRAVESLGGGRAAVAAYGRLPRVAAAAWSYTLVRLECSVRNASVIGVVGGGGLGAELFEELGYGRDDRVATLLLTLLLLTAGSDLAASWARRRLAEPDAIRRRRVGLAVAAGLAGSIVWLTPAALDMASRLGVDDGGFGLKSLGQLLRPDLSGSTLSLAITSSTIPLATAWLATVGSTVLALLLLPWSSAALTRRAAGMSGVVGARWGSVVGLRTLALVLRAVPDVAWLLLLAAALRLGHATALVALLLHSTGVLVRVLSETVDDAAARDPIHGPGGRTAWLAYRIGPAVRSTLVTHALLQGESNLRAAFVLGIVGAGGLGDAFHSAVTFWRLPQASTLAITMVILFVVVDRLARALSRGSVRRATAAARTGQARGRP